MTGLTEAPPPQSITGTEHRHSRNSLNRQTPPEKIDKLIMDKKYWKFVVSKIK